MQAVNPSAEERLARNEAFFREVNERIRDIAGDSAGLRHEFLCECSDATCTERIALSREEYEQVRADPTRFVLAPGHASPGIEVLVQHADDHMVVQKEGPAADVVRELDPRDR